MKKNSILLGIDIAAGVVAAVSAVRHYLHKEKHEIIRHAASLDIEKSEAESEKPDE